jgi:hypothetical protein
LYNYVFVNSIIPISFSCKEIFLSKCSVKKVVYRVAACTL